MGPQLLTAEDLQNIALEVAKTDKLPFVVEVAPAEADAYATVTVANDSRIAMFVDVYNMKDHKWLYTYQIVSGGTTMDTPENYKMMFHKFFRSLNLQMEAKAKELKSKK